MTKDERGSIVGKMGAMLKAIDLDESTLKIHFPTNPDHPCEEENRFRRKPGERQAIPPTTFGK